MKPGDLVRVGRGMGPFEHVYTKSNYLTGHLTKDKLPVRIGQLNNGESALLLEVVPEVLMPGIYLCRILLPSGMTGWLPQSRLEVVP